VLIAVRVALTVVFAVAAVAKLLDMAGSRRALEGFGVPGPLVAPAAAALPVLELTAAALLAVAPTARAGAALALILLVSFISAIVLALRRGVAPDCHCLGQLHSQPAEWETAARNAVLALAAASLLASGPGPAIPWWLAHTDGTTVALVFVGLLTIVLVYTGFSLRHRNRLLTGRGRAAQVPAALKVGQAVPEVDLETVDGSNLPATELLDDDRRAIFVFTNAGCEPSVELLPELARWREVLQARLDIRVLAAGDEQENRRLAAEHGIPLLLDRDGAAVRAFGVEGTPSAVEVDALGRVASPTALGAPAIEGLIRAALERPAQAPGLELHHVKGGVGSRTTGAGS
jgi:Methylamine utilisation protein MauE